MERLEAVLKRKKAARKSRSRSRSRDKKKKKKRRKSSEASEEEMEEDVAAKGSESEQEAEVIWNHLTSIWQIVCTNYSENKSEIVNIVGGYGSYKD